MKPTLSICIPTLNRPELLLQSLNSIFCEPMLLGQLEICIANNASEQDYAAVEKLLGDHASSCSIKYVRQAQRLPLDQNHHSVKRLATAEYIYFLGDDDFFLRDELSKLLQLINYEKPDLAIFNGYLVDEANAYLGRHFALNPHTYDSLIPAFQNLWDQGSFGAVLVRNVMLQDHDFEHLYGTDHAYGCYWLSLFKAHEDGTALKIMVPDFPCVALRCAGKTYNLINVYFKTIPYEMTIRQRLIEPAALRQLIEEQEINFEKFTSSIRFLSHLSESGHDLSTIRTVNPHFFEKYKYRIMLARNIASSAAYCVAKRIYRRWLKRDSQYKASSIQNLINYKLSSATLHEQRKEQAIN